MFQLDPGNLVGLASYLHRRGWAQEVLRAERIGDGNMNLTVRVWTGRGTLVLKQARPYVVKYPQIPAPIERALVEAAFYRVLADSPVAALMPRLLGVDETAYLLLLEDLGEGADCSDVYRGAPLSMQDVTELVGYLRELPRLQPVDPVFANRALRALNHAHQYTIPLQAENGLDLDRISLGLQATAEDLRKDGALVSAMQELGTLYLADGHTLLHGDFFPGSWLRTENGLRVIDPEFCFAGPVEYDLGVLLAHLHLAQRPELAPFVWQHYGACDQTLAERFAGAEIIRRLIGVAQLPLLLDLAGKQRLLSMARGLVCD
jgi:5-methylthioribose kinase